MSNHRLLESFFLAETSEVLKAFAATPGAIDGGAWVYIPGTLPPERRALVVAHADTVGTKPPTRITWHGNIALADTYGSSSDWWKGKKGGSSYSRIVLGADDRAGCAIAWAFRKSGHSILICDEEETGCWGSKNAAKHISKELSEHLFAVQVDRRGDCNYVTYDCETPDWRAFLTDILGADWTYQHGSFSDIAVLCPAAEICGVNLAAGYLNEHTSNETFFLDAWQRTQGAVQRLLNAAESGRYSRFHYEEPLVSPKSSHWSWGWEDSDYLRCTKPVVSADSEPLLLPPVKDEGVVNLDNWKVPDCPKCETNEYVYFYWENYAERIIVLKCGECEEIFTEQLLEDEPPVDDFAAANNAALVEMKAYICMTCGSDEIVLKEYGALQCEDCGSYYIGNKDNPIVFAEA